MTIKIFFIFLVLVLLVGCTEKNAIDDPSGLEIEEQAGESGDNGIGDVFSDTVNVEPPQAPN